MKKLFTLIAVLLCALTNTFANAFTEYKNHIAKDRVLLMFNEGLSAERKAELINASGVVNDFTHLPSPHVTICMVSDYEKAVQYFSSVQDVRFVSFFITDGKHYAGVMDDYFVKLKDKSFEPLLKAKVEREHLGKAVADKYVPNLYHLQNNKSVNTVEVCAGFITEGWCEYASPNYLLNPEVCSNDPLYTRQWNLENNGTSLQGSGTADADMDVDSAWMITTGDPNLKIAVVDAGVDTLHPDLAANMLPGHDAVSDSTDGYPTPNYPNDGHGTCCAGIIAAVKDNNIGIAGVAPGCKIIPIRSFYYIFLSGASDPLPYSTSAIFADAIGWAWNDAGADILSNSWGLPDTLIPFLPGGIYPVNDAIHTCYTQGRGGKGAPMFFSSGNDDAPTGPIWPSKLPEAIAVGATSMCDERKNPADCSSETWWGGDYGNGLAFSAPGVRIASTDIRAGKGFSNNDYYYSFNGTSAACPNAAGVGALVMTLRPELPADDIKNIIAQSADRVGGYDYSASDVNGTYSFELGHGRVNANRAVHFAFDYSGIKNEGSDNGWKVYPNPNSGSFTVKVQCNADMKVMDLAGREVMRTPLTKGENRVDGSALPEGIYIVQLTIGSSITTGKVSILR
ncbi:MAG: S8 family peptidase [Chitinophagales bacterium]